MRPLHAALSVAVIALFGLGTAVAAADPATPAATPAPPSAHKAHRSHTDLLVIAVSPDGKTAAVGADDGRLWLEEAGTGAPVAELKGPQKTISAALFTPDSRTVISAGDDHVLLWDVASRRQLGELRHDRAVASTALSPDGQLLVTICERTSEFYCWLLASRRLIWRARTGGAVPTAVCWTADGKRVLVSSDGQELGTFDARTGALGPGIPIEGAKHLAVSPDGKLLAVTGDDYEVRVWDLSAGKAIQSFHDHNDTLDCIAFAPKGQLLASCADDDSICVHDLATGRNLRLQGHTDDVERVSFSPDGKMLISCGDDATVRRWNLTTGVQISSQKHLPSLTQDE